jgi:hypothetical protein
MRRINHLVGGRQDNRVALRAHEVAAPPGVVAMIGLHALDEHQPALVDRLDRVPRPGRRGFPVIRAATAPGRGTMRLVREIGADDRVAAPVTRREQLPIGDPLRLGIAAVVPQPVIVRAGTRRTAMVVQDDLEAEGPSIGHDLVHDLQAVQSLEIRVLRIVDTVRHARAIE